jgi:hypothetical protein
MNDTGRAEEADEVDLDEELADAMNEAERQGHRADYFARLAEELARDVASAAHDEAVASAKAALMSAEAFGLAEPEAGSAWHEAAQILQADGHALQETVRDDVHSAARDAVARLTVTQRECLWLEHEHHESNSGADMWARAVPYTFDPLEAYPRSLCPAIDAIAAGLEDALRRANLAALAIAT